MASQGTAATQANPVSQRHGIYIDQIRDNLANYNERLQTLQTFLDSEASQHKAIARVALEDILQDTLAIADQRARALEKATRALEWIRTSNPQGQPGQLDQSGQDVQLGQRRAQGGQPVQLGQPRAAERVSLSSDLLGLFDPMANVDIGSGPPSQMSSSFSAPTGRVFVFSNRTCELGAFNPVICTCIYIYI